MIIIIYASNNSNFNKENIKLTTQIEQLKSEIREYETKIIEYDSLLTQLEEANYKNAKLIIDCSPMEDEFNQFLNLNTNQNLKELKSHLKHIKNEVDKQRKVISSYQSILSKSIFKKIIPNNLYTEIFFGKEITQIKEQKQKQRFLLPQNVIQKINKINLKNNEGNIKEDELNLEGNKLAIKSFKGDHKLQFKFLNDLKFNIQSKNENVNENEISSPKQSTDLTQKSTNSKK